MYRIAQEQNYVTTCQRTQDMRMTGGGAACADLSSLDREFPESNIRKRLNRFEGGPLSCTVRSWILHELEPEVPYWSLHYQSPAVSARHLLPTVYRILPSVGQFEREVVLLVLDDPGREPRTLSGLLGQLFNRLGNRRPASVDRGGIRGEGGHVVGNRIGHFQQRFELSDPVSRKLGALLRQEIP